MSGVATDSSRPVAVVLVSGGLDSATCLAIARSEGFRCHALSFAYGQRHAAELHAADAVTRALQRASVPVLPFLVREVA